MHIDKAKNLNVGDHVYCPADGGETAYTGRVTSVGTVEARDIFGNRYIWIEVYNRHVPKKTVWPSNRLG